jgi:hypothetical protein
MSAPSTAPLIFNWDQPRRRNLAFAGFIVASFGIHIACFYLFQVVYPSTVSLLPAPQRVNLMTANSEQTATLLRWIDAEDPALASTTRRPPHLPRREMGKVEHVPSYFTSEPALKEPPPLVEDLEIPSVRPPGPVPMTRPAVAPSTGIQPTRVVFSSDLQRLGAGRLAAPNFKASTTEPPQDALFRIAVDTPGAVVYCFTLTSSGDEALDEQARQHLALCRFPIASTADSGALVWGIATIEWGNDVATPTAKPTPSEP